MEPCSNSPSEVFGARLRIVGAALYGRFADSLANLSTRFVCLLDFPLRHSKMTGFADFLRRRQSSRHCSVFTRGAPPLRFQPCWDQPLEDIAPSIRNCESV